MGRSVRSGRAHAEAASPCPRRVVRVQPPASSHATAAARHKPAGPPAMPVAHPILGPMSPTVTPGRGWCVSRSRTCTGQPARHSRQLESTACCKRRQQHTLRWLVLVGDTRVEAQLQGTALGGKAASAAERRAAPPPPAL